MKVNKIFDVMDLARRARSNGKVFNPLFVSAPGLGKTEITQQWAKEKNLRSIVMTLSSYDPTDFKGYPNIQLINGRQRQSFATPDFWPDEGEGVIILEELNRAPAAIMQCILSLTDSRRGFDGYRLPEGWMVVGCINPEGGEYDVTSMDPALKDRFEMFNVTYDKPVFLNYMKNQNWHKDLINFVESGLWVYKSPEEIGNTPGSKYVGPRTLSKIATVLEAGFDNELELELYETELGRNVAKDFYNFRYNESPVMMNDLNKNLKASLKKLKQYSNPDNYKNGMISLTVRDIVEENTITDEVLIQVVKVIPVEQSTVLVREIEFKRDDKTILQRICKADTEIKELLKSVLRYGK